MACCESLFLKNGHDMSKKFNSATLAFQFWLSFYILVGFFFSVKAERFLFSLHEKLCPRYLMLEKQTQSIFHYDQSIMLFLLAVILRRKSILVGDNSHEYPRILTSHILS